MFHWFGVVHDDKGNALPGWQVEVVDLDTTNVVSIFSDESGTAISAVSGVANRAVADVAGNYDLFVPSGTYSLRFYDTAGVFQRTQRYLPMYGNVSEEIADAIVAAADSITSEQKLILLADSGETVPAGVYPVDENVRYASNLTRFYGKADGATTFDLQVNGVTVYTGSITTTLSETIDIDIEVGDRVAYAILATSARYIYLNADGGAG